MPLAAGSAAQRAARGARARRGTDCGAEGRLSGEIADPGAAGIKRGTRVMNGILAFDLIGKRVSVFVD
jgi:hypothetical protein